MRAKAYRDTRLDWVREGQGRLKRQTVDKGLLRETEAVQSQIQALVKCDVGTTYSEASMVQRGSADFSISYSVAISRMRSL